MSHASSIPVAPPPTMVTVFAEARAELLTCISATRSLSPVAF
jgi:hypothetical protein